MVCSFEGLRSYGMVGRPRGRVAASRRWPLRCDIVASSRLAAIIKQAMKSTREQIQLLFGWTKWCCDCCSDCPSFLHIIFLKWTAGISLTRWLSSSWRTSAVWLGLDSNRPTVTELFFLVYLFRSTSKSRSNNIRGGENIRPSVHEKFLRFQWNLVCR